MNVPKNRQDFIRWVVETNNVKTIAEVGVQDGKFSSHLVSLNPQKLYLIDSWRHIPGQVDRANVSDDGHLIKYLMVLEKFLRPNVYVIRGESVDVAKSMIKLGIKIDLVYLDADHSYKAVKEDLNMWSQVATILSGHDYVPDGIKHNSEFGVKSAVDEHATKHNLVLYTNEGQEEWPSWCLMKGHNIGD